MKPKRVRKSEPVPDPSVDLVRRAVDVLMQAGAQHAQTEALRSTGKFWTDRPNPASDLSALLFHKDEAMRAILEKEDPAMASAYRLLDLEQSRRSKQASHNASGPRNALTELMSACFDNMEREGRIPSGRRQLLDAVRACDPTKKIVQYIPGEGDMFSDKMGHVSFIEQGGARVTMSLRAISTWLHNRKKKH